MCVCMMTWAITVSFLLLWCINKIITIRMEVHCELLGADLTEHHIKHGQVNDEVKYHIRININLHYR